MYVFKISSLLVVLAEKVLAEKYAYIHIKVPAVYAVTSRGRPRSSRLYLSGTPAM